MGKCLITHGFQRKDVHWSLKTFAFSVWQYITANIPIQCQKNGFKIHIFVEMKQQSCWKAKKTSDRFVYLKYSYRKENSIWV